MQTAFFCGPQFTYRNIQEYTYNGPVAAFVNIPPVDLQWAMQSQYASSSAAANYSLIASTFSRLSAMKERIEHARNLVVGSHIEAINSLAHITINAYDPTLPILLLRSYQVIPTCHGNRHEIDCLQTAYATVNQYYPGAIEYTRPESPPLFPEEDSLLYASVLPAQFGPNPYDFTYNEGLNSHLISTLMTFFQLHNTCMQMQDPLEHHVRRLALLSIAYKTLHVASYKIAEQFLLPLHHFYCYMDEELSRTYPPTEQRLFELEAMLYDTRQILESYHNYNLHDEVSSFNNNLQDLYIKLINKINVARNINRSQSSYTNAVLLSSLQFPPITDIPSSFGGKAKMHSDFSVKSMQLEKSSSSKKGGSSPVFGGGAPEGLSESDMELIYAKLLKR